VKNRTPGATLLDVRSEEEVGTGVIPGSLLIPADQVLERLSEIPQNEKIIIYCKSGLRAEMAYSLLKERGYSVRYLPRTLDIKKDGSFTIF
jgi:rhodanese-related sulfurtransferase